MFNFSDAAIHDVMFARKMDFSDFSRKQPCPRCRAVDHHFVRPASTFKVIGLVRDQNAWLVVKIIYVIFLYPVLIALIFNVIVS